MPFDELMKSRVSDSKTPLSKLIEIKRRDQAHAPTKLIQAAPKSTNRHAATRFLPLRTLQLWSLKKSSANNSISAANTSSPDDTAFIVPTRIRPNSEFGL